MKNLINILLLSMLTIACRTVDQSELGIKKTVEFHATVHKPYCGGAKPSPDVAAGYYESMKYEKFSLIQGTEFSENSKVFQEVTLDEGGNVIMSLDPGAYVLVHSDKLLSLNEFIKKNQPQEKTNFAVLQNSCFEEWKKTIDLKFTVVNDTIIEYRQKARCWTGINPCIKYTGPPAP